MANSGELISVVLVNYKRPKDLEQIIQHLKANLPVGIGEVHVWDNSGLKKNIGVLGRWLAVERCKYSTIFTQDDDCIVANCADILAAYNGKNTSNGLRASHYGPPRKLGPGWETLVGWGSVFNRDSIAPVLDEYLSKYQEDELLYVQADRIVTTLLRRYHNTIFADVTDFPSATDPAISMHLQPGYNEQIAEVRRRLATFS